MILAITILYTVCVIVAFKYIKLKVNSTNIAVAVVIGILMIGGIVVAWQLSSPVSNQVVLKRFTVQMVPDSKGLITKLHVPQDQPVKKGDPLFEIEKEPYQNPVDQYEAELAAAKQRVLQSKSGIKLAAATVKRVEADSAVAKADYDTAIGINEDTPGAIAKLKVVQAELKYKAAQAAVEEAKAALQQSEFALSVDEKHVDSVQTLLDTANYNLEQTTYRAPADGIIMAWQGREQTMTAKLSGAAVGVFLDYSETVVGAVYPQNMLRNVQPGDPVDIAFRSTPGKVWTGKVERIVNYTGEGQFAPSGTIPIAADVSSNGFLTVRIVLDDHEAAKSLPLGADGHASIYTNSGKPFHIISKIYMRMQGLLYYLPM